MKGRYCNGFVHTIQQGDTLYLISRKYRVPLALILRANPYVDVYNMQIGQEICVPVMHRPGVPGFRRMEDERERDENRPEEMMQVQGMRMENREEGPLERESKRKMTTEADLVMEEEKEIYITDGEKSLGDLFQEFGVNWEDFAKHNDLSQVLLADDVVLYFPKKV